MKIQQFSHKRFVVPVSRILAINYIERTKEVGVKGYQFSNLHYGSPKKCTARQTKYIHSIKAVNKLCRGIRFYTKMHLFSHCAVVSMIYHGPMLALPHLFLDIFPPYTSNIHRSVLSKIENFGNFLFPPASGASWGILNRYWLDPDKTAKSPKCFANFHRLPEVTRQKEGYF